MSEPLNVLEVKDQVGFRLTERDKQNIRVLMTAARINSPTKLLRDLMEREAETIRDAWQAQWASREEVGAGG